MDRNQLLIENQEFKEYNSSNWRYSFFGNSITESGKDWGAKLALIMRKIEIFPQMLLVSTSQDLEN